MRFFDVFRIMRADLRADAVLERGDDLSASGIVLRVCAEDDGHIERKTYRVALNLHVAFLHDVEERDLDLTGEIGNLIDGEDATVRAGQRDRSASSARFQDPDWIARL